MDGYISTAEAAKLIGCVDSRVRVLLRGGRIVGERVGRDWLVLKSSAEAYRDSDRTRGRRPVPKKTARKGKGKK